MHHRSFENAFVLMGPKVKNEKQTHDHWKTPNRPLFTRGGTPFA